MSRIVRSLCAMPSFGVLGGSFGSPTFIGGVSGAIVEDTIDFDTLTGRALVADGHTITDADDLAAGWAFTSDMVVWFDGVAALYGLTRHADSASFAMSFWFNPYPETAGSPQVQNYGAVFANSIGTEVVADGDDTPSYFGVKYTSTPPDNSSFSSVVMTMPGSHHGDHVTNGGAPASVSSASSNLSIAGYFVSEIDEMQGWSHVMVGIHASGGKSKLTIWVDDTEIVTDGDMGNNAFWNNSAPIADEAWVVGFSDPTFTDPNGDYGDPGEYNAPWVVGGVFNTSHPNTLPKDDQEGNGMIGAITEMWIAPGQFIDWSNSANRLKFHNVDLTGTMFAPTNLGSRGQTPTGTRPQYYFTGPPAKFPINRGVGGAAVSVWHRAESTTLEGLVDVLTSYGIIPGPV